MLRPVLMVVAAATLVAGCASAPLSCLPAAAPAPAAAADAASAATPAAAAVTTPLASTDAALTQALIGGWIVPKESSDFRRAPVREVYRADGTYSLFFFDTPSCGKVVRQVDANWHVERGIIVATVIYVSTSQFGKAGDVSTDQIITMDGTNMTLHSMHDGVFGWSLGNSMFSRRKAEGCYDPTAKY